MKTGKFDKTLDAYRKMLNEQIDDTTDDEKSFLITYMSGKSTRKKIIQTNDIESYIKSEFSFEVSVVSKLNKNVFLEASEVERKGASWHIKPRGERWYSKVVDAFSRELAKGRNGSIDYKV